MNTLISKNSSSLVTLMLIALVTTLALASDGAAFANEHHSRSHSHTSQTKGAQSKHGHHYIVGKGSFYHKVASDFGDYTGITGVITLPQPQIDPLRHDKKGKPLDGFSIYMGGNADGQEVDAGFSWERNPIKGEAPMVWRPFARATRWLNADSLQTWKPGDTVRISVTMVGDGKLKLSIADVGVEHPRTYDRVFSAWRFRKSAARQFKRVNAIDQCGREGQETLPSRSTVYGANWSETYLLRSTQAKQVKLALNAVKHTEVNEGKRNTRVRQDKGQAKAGGELVDVFGSSEVIELSRAPILGSH